MLRTVIVAYSALIVFALASCVLHSPKSPTVAPERYLLPLSAKNTDIFCAETLPTVAYSVCLPVGEVRQFLLSAQAAP